MKRFLVFLAILLLLGTGYFTYNKWVKDSDISTWSFVPGNAVLVFETNSPLDGLNSLEQTEIWQTLSHMETFSQVDSRLSLLDSLAGKGNFSSFFSDNPVLISLMVTSSTNFDYLFVVEIQNLSQQTYISKAQAHFIQKGYQKKTREYDGFTITELIGKDSEETFTYIFYKNYFIGSFSAFLVEDAIRTVSDLEISGFKDKNAELYPLTKLTRDQGNLYVDVSSIETLLNIYQSKPLSLNFGKSSFLDVKTTEDALTLTGFTFAESEDFLSVFKSSEGAAFEMAEIIPMNTAACLHFGSSEPTKLGTSIGSYLKVREPEVLQIKQELLETLDFDVDYTYNLIDDEIGLLTLESNSSEELDHLLILEISDMGEALRFFNSIGERNMVKTGDSLYRERYGSNELRRLPTNEFPKALLGEMAGKWDDVYYVTFRNYLIFGNRVQQLKLLLTSIEEEATWTKSLRVNEFLNRTNKEVNLSFYANISSSWKSILKQLKPEWKSYFSENQFALRNLEFLAVQFNTVDDKFYTGITLYQPEILQQSLTAQSTEIASITLPDFITSKPYLVTNHQDRSLEVLVQDTASNLYLVGANFEVLWSLSLPEKIISSITQVDYYNNGKLQYAFATEEAVYLIDRTGSYLPEYPKKPKGINKIAHFEIIDYDKTKKYRFALANNRGEVVITDKNLNVLPGWDPMVFKSPLVQPPTHHRIDGKDVLMFLESNGWLHLLTRKGSSYPGFPKEIGTTIHSPLFVKNANSFQESVISLMTTGGELLEFNFLGELLRREQLYKPATETAFAIVEDVTGNAFVIQRKTGNTYEFLDEKGLLLFSKDYLTERLSTQYYQLGGGNQLMAIVDPAGSYLYLYNLEGTLLTGRALTSTTPISLMQYESEFRIFKAVDRNLELISVSY